jgi:formate hydrogenlyase subunit 3/multisubunit Na+/H+ antiporter MnhD subunit
VREFQKRIQEMAGMTHMDLPWTLTGIRFGFDEISRAFLFFTALLWLISGVYAHYYMKQDRARSRFFLFYLLAMAGNTGLLLSQDMVSFYLFFALMTFAAYPLIIHEGTPKARYAGKVYIIMAVIGEALLVSAMTFIASNAESAVFRDIAVAVSSSGNRNLIIILVLAGFGIKAGAVPLHMWLPLAHPVAPTPASAVLSGVMIKAGLLGWIRFLPPGGGSMPECGSVCIAAGLIGAFYGVVTGLTQNDLKTVLAYSSISQMGLMLVILGICLLVPEGSRLGLTALFIYSLHHALNKGALFLGVGAAAATGGIWHRRLVGLGLLLPCLSLAGSPFTSGAVAKASLKAISETVHGGWAGWLEWLLPLTAVGTTALMGRFFLLAVTSRKTEEAHGPAAGVLLSWAILSVCAAAAGFALPFDDPIGALRLSLSVESVLSASWPVLGGAFLVWAARLLNKRASITFRISIPPGDVLQFVVAMTEALKTFWGRHVVTKSAGLKSCLTLKLPVLLHKREGISRVFTQIEGGLSRWFIAGMLFFLLSAILFVLISRAMWF